MALLHVRVDEFCLQWGLPRNFSHQYRYRLSPQGTGTCRTGGRDARWKTRTIRKEKDETPALLEGLQNNDRKDRRAFLKTLPKKQTAMAPASYPCPGKRRGRAGLKDSFFNTYTSGSDTVLVRRELSGQTGIVFNRQRIRALMQSGLLSARDCLQTGRETKTDPM